MQEVFEKIIEKLEEYRDENLVEHDSEMANHCKQDCNDANDCTLCVWNKAIEIVKSESEKCKDGHFGCNTNGEHEKCNGCGLTDCKSRNKIWFGAGDDDTDTNVGNNSWIPCSKKLPELRQDVLVTVKYTGFMGMHGYWIQTGHMEAENDWCGNCAGSEVIAWQPLPEPYQPKGE